ncbi:hypothetical protein T484DRAFT_1760444 [Baffinella frigidus]|nr:hypothetical protein T484DRAFT_1760444 [Cryptophyta sp. CCMP2293]
MLTFRSAIKKGDADEEVEAAREEGQGKLRAAKEALRTLEEELLALKAAAAVPTAGTETGGGGGGGGGAEEARLGGALKALQDDAHAQALEASAREATLQEETRQLSEQVTRLTAQVTSLEEAAAGEEGRREEGWKAREKDLEEEFEGQARATAADAELSSVKEALEEANKEVASLTEALQAAETALKKASKGEAEARKIALSAVPPQGETGKLQNEIAEAPAAAVSQGTSQAKSAEAEGAGVEAASEAGPNAAPEDDPLSPSSVKNVVTHLWGAALASFSRGAPLSLPSPEGGSEARKKRIAELRRVTAVRKRGRSA